MIGKSGYRFSGKIMLKREAKAKLGFKLKSFRFGVWSPSHVDVFDLRIAEDFVEPSP